MRRARAFILIAVGVVYLQAQVHSPKVLLKDQHDATDLRLFAQGIYQQAGAQTARERAEAVWRFFLTDGRFVKPGFWYHIAGWAYEEPMGEVLDPMKLLNSYGFGLCYQIAPLLEAVWKAGGFDDARVWFLTGHTVAEVFYDGSYHYFDSDMMGYNTIGSGPAKSSRVASVHDIESDPSIVTGKLKGPRQVNTVSASDPWFPADVNEGAIPGLAEVFATKADNWLFPLERSPQGHSMSFELRPGERLVRYFRPEREGLFYLPYKRTGREWEEFPKDIKKYSIRTECGPASQKDARRWATGAIEYRPVISQEAAAVYEARSPYVIIDAEFRLSLSLASAQQSVSMETSVDGGRTWSPAGSVSGPHKGPWRAEPAVLTRSPHGRLTRVSGTYGYFVKVIKSPGAVVEDLSLVTRIQVNPRTLPDLKPGHNELVFTAGARTVRREIPLEPATLRDAAHSSGKARFVTDGAQGYWLPDGDAAAEFVFRLADDSGRGLTGFAAGGRVLDLRSGLAPDKFTAEVRPVTPLPDGRPAASIAWSESPTGPFQTIWEFDPDVKWKDGRKEDRTLLWPEVDRHVALSAKREVYVRYRIQNVALDHVRLAMETQAPNGSSPLEVSHLWKENGVSRSFRRTIPAGVTAHNYVIDLPAGAQISNEAIVFECKRQGK